MLREVKAMRCFERLGESTSSAGERSQQREHRASVGRRGVPVLAAASVMPAVPLTVSAATAATVPEATALQSPLTGKASSSSMSGRGSRVGTSRASSHGSRASEGGRYYVSTDGGYSTVSHVSTGGDSTASRANILVGVASTGSGRRLGDNADLDGPQAEQPPLIPLA